MAVTIQMIETKEFKVKPSGYDPEEVDVFLDSIIDEFEDMEREITTLRADLAREKSAPAPAPVIQQDNSETAQKLLANAQRVSDETMADARKQADLILADARTKAERIIADAEKENRRLQDNLDTLRDAVRDYRERFKRLVNDQMHLIDVEKQLFE